MHLVHECPANKHAASKAVAIWWWPRRAWKSADMIVTKNRMYTLHSRADVGQECARYWETWWRTTIGMRPQWDRNMTQAAGLMEDMNRKETAELPEARHRWRGRRGLWKWNYVMEYEGHPEAGCLIDAWPWGQPRGRIFQNCVICGILLWRQLSSTWVDVWVPDDDPPPPSRTLSGRWRDATPRRTLLPDGVV